MVEPTWMPVVYAPVPSAGRSGMRSRTAIGAIALPIPMPTPTGIVSSTTVQALGESARAMPTSPISASARVIARRVPTRAARYAASGAKIPMQSTGIVPSRPAIACVVPSPCWMLGISGPTPMICGRSARAARNNAARAPE